MIWGLKRVEVVGALLDSAPLHGLWRHRVEVEVSSVDLGYNKDR